MAETITNITQPAPFIEAAAKPFLRELQQAVGGFKQADLSKVLGPQFVAGPGQLTLDAEQLASGLGSFAPFLQTAATQAEQAGQFVGPQAFQQFTSPFQQDVIDTTLAEFDRQTARGLPSIAAQATAAGVLGGGREGVQRAEFLSNQDRNRAALQAQLLQQGFTQAQQAASNAFNQQQALAQQQSQLAQLAPSLQGQQIAGLTTLGSQQQARAQAGLTAQQALAQAQQQQPLTAAQTLGSGIMGLISGYPAATQTQQIPSISPLQSALGIGSTLAGIYRLTR
jgi:hypothetical protein|tara:strand:- start:5135 stop:5980 length:846 start_codon:yes stop_codon:yes gene_type:complete